MRFAPALLVFLAACAGGEAPKSETPEAPTDKPAEAVPAEPAAAAVPADVSAPPADAIKTASGLSYKILTPIAGAEKPTADAVVKVDYTGWTTDGKQFDSSIGRGPAQFPLKGVIPGWTEGLQLMGKGETARLWIPKELAYNDAPGMPAGMLVFDVTLLDFTIPPPPPATPADVAAPPKDAKKTATGLYYKVLTPGNGTEHPKADSTVVVNYTGWTTDGKMFDSSVVRGRPMPLPLNGVIAGWTEGVQLLVAGDKARFWIPEELAYKGRPGAPKGMLVFDIDLLDNNM